MPIFSSLDNSFGSNGYSVLQLSIVQNFSTKFVRVLVGDTDNLLINTFLWWPLLRYKTHPSFVLMPMGSPGLPCEYSRCIWNSGISTPIIKDVLLLAVDNRRSLICHKCFFVRLIVTLKKGLLRSSTTHTFDNFIGFRCDEKEITENC